MDAMLTVSWQSAYGPGHRRLWAPAGKDVGSIPPIQGSRERQKCFGTAKSKTIKTTL